MLLGKPIMLGAFSRVCRYSTEGAGTSGLKVPVVEKYKKLADLVAEEAKPQRKKATKKPTTTTEKPKKRQGVDATQINKELVKLTAIPMVPKISNSEHSLNTRFIHEAKIWREWSAHDFKRVQELPSTTPEVLFLGRCNVGKSSLINALLTKQTKETKESTVFAYVKQQAGYTPCLNFYNIGKKVRIVDSPGYGQKGRSWQGKMVMEYLQRRHGLVNTYVVLDANIGVTDHDIIVFDMLEQTGVTFEVVLNKVDKLKTQTVAQQQSVLVAQQVAQHVKIPPPSYAAICGDKAVSPALSGVSEVLSSVLRHANCCGGDSGARVEHFYKKTDSARRT